MQFFHLVMGNTIALHRLPDDRKLTIKKWQPTGKKKFILMQRTGGAPNYLTIKVGHIDVRLQLGADRFLEKARMYQQEHPKQSLYYRKRCLAKWLPLLY